ncbi:MAG: FecR domain-containing protein [Verrucomicrobiales bacterium]
MKATTFCIATLLALPLSATPGLSEVILEHSERDARLNNGSIQTGTGARAQVGVPGQGSVRFGSKTQAYLDENKSNLSLSKGIALVSTEGRLLGRNRMSVDTGDYRSTVRGSMQVEYRPGEYIMMVCIEGKVTVKLKSVFSEFVSITEGQMLIINPTEKNLPNPVEVDLSRLAETSSLLSDSFASPLAASALIDRALNSQQAAIAGGDVMDTGLILDGNSLAVSTGGFDQQGDLQNRTDVAAEEAAAAAEEDNAATPTPAPAPSTGGGGELPIGHRSGRSSNPGFLIDDTSTISDSAISTPGYGELPANDGPFFLVPSNPAKDADLAFSGDVTLSGPLTISAPDGIIDVSGNVNSDSAMNLIGQDISLGQNSIDLGEAFLTVGSASGHGNRGGVVNLTSMTLNAGGLAINSSQSAMPSGNPRAPWIPYPDFPVDVSFSTINVPGEIMASGAGPGVFVEVYDSAFGSGDRSSRSIQLYSTSTSAEASAVNSSRSDAVNIFSSTVGGNRTELIEMLAPNGSTLVQSSTVSATASLADQLDGVTADGSIEIFSKGLTVDNSTLEATSDIDVLSNGVTIAITDSSQLASLAGNIALLSAGGNVDVLNSVLRADAGEVLIDSEMVDADSVINVMNSTISADTIRMRAFGTSGDSIIIDNSTMNANRLIELYAEGMSNLHFRGDVKLNTPEAILAAQNVQVDAGGNVTATGIARIFANEKNYNKAGFGGLSASQIQESTFSERPTFSR